ncbi:leukosialin [Pteropus alecto]|uniref:Leukosialin n=1 Tax=Pteropus alecto TaxID=9402 RepID=L5KKA0_PTEAL|nr:leukosialin [Pteropus alecto]ELK10953.1 Leukosialin [Pteropus alecto]
MEMALLLLLLGCFSVQEVNTESQKDTTTLQTSNFTLASTIFEALNLNSRTSDHMLTTAPEKNDSTGHWLSSSSSILHTASDVSSPETSIATSGGLLVSDSTIPQEVSTEKSSMLQEISNETSNPIVPTMTTMTGGITTIGSLETFGGTGGPSVTVAASYLETLDKTGGLSVTMVTSSLETSDGTGGLPVTMATSSLETSDGTGGLPVTMVTSSLETSDGTGGLPVTMVTSSLETSDGTGGLPVTMVTSSLETPKGPSGSPISRVKISTMTTPGTSANTGSRLSPNSKQGTNNSWLMAVVMSLLVVIVLLALLLLWRQRQKRRTGALTLSRGGKRNGVVDAWAGPARMSDEEAVITAGVSGGDKASGVPEGEGSGRRPTLTTFFGRRKSCQGSLALEELKAGSAPSLEGEEEPLVDSEDRAMEAPASDGPEAGDVEVP